MSKNTLPFLMLVFFLGGCAPLSGRYPGGIPQDMMQMQAQGPRRGDEFRASLREWMGPPPSPAEEPTIRPPHSQFHPVPIRPVFGPDTSPLAAKFPTLRPPAQKQTTAPRHVESATPEPKATNKDQPKPLAKPAKPIKKKAPGRIQEASFQREQPAATTSTLPKFRILRR